MNVARPSQRFGYVIADVRVADVAMEIGAGDKPVGGGHDVGCSLQDVVRNRCPGSRGDGVGIRQYSPPLRDERSRPLAFPGPPIALIKEPAGSCTRHDGDFCISPNPAQ